MVALFASLMLGAQSAPSLTFQNNTFIYRNADQITTVYLEDPLPNPEFQNEILYYESEVGTIVFDRRGLGVPINGLLQFTKLPFVFRSDRIFPESQRESILRGIESGDYKQDPAGLSGFAVHEGYPIFIVRFETGENAPWFDAVIRLDIDAKPPRSEVLGKLRGTALGGSAIRDRVVHSGDELKFVSRTNEGWGIETFNLRTLRSDFVRLGSNIDDGHIGPSARFGWTQTRTSYGTRVIGFIDVARARHEEVSEIRGNLVHFEPPYYLKYATGNEATIIDLSTGAKVPTSRESRMASIENGLLVYSPPNTPRHAILYRNGDFWIMARWSRPSTSQ